MQKADKQESPACHDLAEKVEPNHDVNALFSALRLDQTHYQSFSRRRNVSPPEQIAKTENIAFQREGRVHIGVFSPMGGSGKSTLSTSLGSMLCQLGRRVLLVDTSPWQVLAFHYGATEARPGKRSFFAPGGRDSAVHILARDQNDVGVPDLDSFVATTPVDCVFFDLGGVLGEILLAYLRECDVVLVPLLPDSSAVRLAAAVKLLLGKLKPSPARVMFVINQMDDSPIAKRVQTLLMQAHGEQLFSSAIFRQPEVQQALADGVVLPFYAPKSQAISVFDEIVRWLQIPEAASTKTVQRWSEG